MRRCVVFLLQFFSFLPVLAQKALIMGRVVDMKSGEALMGVAVKRGETAGTITDLNGMFNISVAPGRHSLQFSFVGYQELTKEVKVAEGDTVTMLIELSVKSEELDIVVVTGSKYRRQLSKETTSIEVLKADQIKSTNAVTVAEALNRIPGVTLVDDQPTIRSGSGYSYGVGSRVLVMVDELPVITADRGDVRWNHIPLEIVEQVEVLKASSSALYGASALNGAINVRTKFPREQPETQATVFYHIYANPRNDTLKWWGEPNGKNIDETVPNDTVILPDSTIQISPNTSVHLNDPRLLPPTRYGAFFSHARKINRFDVVIGGALEKERGYIRLNDRQFIRMVGKFRHRPQRYERLSYGINFNMMDSKETDFFLWKNPTWGAYIPLGSDDYDDRGTLARGDRQNITFEPYLIFFDQSEGRHTLRSRYNRLAVQFTSNYPIAHIIYGDYQYQKKFPKTVTLITGATGEYDIINDQESFGNHKFTKGSLFAQVDLEIKQLLISAGARAETFSLDKSTDTTAVTGKLGFNYQAARRTYLRLNAGLGYRFPSIAELFVSAGIEGFTVFPNPALSPEYGGSGELGIKQGIKISNWVAYLDWAFFWQEYYDMIEFTFGDYTPPDSTFNLKWLGFKSVNISRARVAGYELSFVGEGSFGKIPVRTFGGYTFTYPVELNPVGGDETLNNVGNYLRNFFKSMVHMDDEIYEGLLRYRYRHTLKADVEVDLGKFTVGTEFQYYSFIEKIDDYLTFPISPIREMDLYNYRLRQQQRTIEGNVFWNLRGSYNFGKYGRFSVIINNVMNRESSYRPGKMDPPLNFVFQYSVKI